VWFVALFHYFSSILLDKLFIFHFLQVNQPCNNHKNFYNNINNGFLGWVRTACCYRFVKDLCVLLKFLFISQSGLIRETPKRSAIFYQYFKAELAPPGPKEWPAVEQGFRNVYRVFHDQSWKEMSTRVSCLFLFHIRVKGSYK
jgi:hypothetical protein